MSAKVEVKVTIDGKEIADGQREINWMKRKILVENLADPGYIRLGGRFEFKVTDLTDAINILARYEGREYNG